MVQEILKKRIYAIGKPAKATKAALLLSSAAPGPYTGAIGAYQAAVGFMGLQDVGVVCAAGDENGSADKMEEVRAFAKSL